MLDECKVSVDAGYWRVQVMVQGMVQEMVQAWVLISSTGAWT
jgi:hypothetical protein